MNTRQYPKRRFVIEVDEASAVNLYELADRCTRASKNDGASTSHGALSMPAMLAMLAENAAMVITRQGSWEGANMAQVFSSHGYEV